MDVAVLDLAIVEGGCGGEGGRGRGVEAAEVVGAFVGEDGVGLQGGVNVGGHDVFVDEGDVGVVLGGAEVGGARVGYLVQRVSLVVGLGCWERVRTCGGIGCGNEGERGENGVCSWIIGEVSLKCSLGGRVH